MITVGTIVKINQLKHPFAVGPYILKKANKQDTKISIRILMR